MGECGEGGGVDDGLDWRIVWITDDLWWSILVWWVVLGLDLKPF